MQQSLHPDKRRHGASLETLPQTAIIAPVGPWSIQNATTKQVNDTQACNVEHSWLTVYLHTHALALKNFQSI